MNPFTQQHGLLLDVVVFEGIQYAVGSDLVLLVLAAVVN